METVYGYPVTRRNGETWIRLRDLESDGRARVVTALRAPTNLAGAPPVVELTLQYRVADPKIAARFEDGLAQAGFTLGHSVTNDSALVERGRDTDVLAAGARAYAAEALDQATRLYADGRRREASRMLRTRLEEVMLRNTTTIRSDDLAQEMKRIQIDADFESNEAGSTAGKDMVKSMKVRAMGMAR